jgi:hypothetical protein
MHHYRGKLYQGDKIHLDPANVYIDFSSTATDTDPEWSGYLLVASEKAVAQGASYTLKLEDGRSGELRISSFDPDDSDKFRALFAGAGSLK